MKKASEIGSRFKTMIMKHTEASPDRSEPEIPPPLPSPVFDLAPPSLDLASQALQNLQNFKSYLELAQSDGPKYFPSVAESFSQALTFLRNRTSDRASQLSEAKTAASDFEEQESRNRALKMEYSDQLGALQAEEGCLRAQLEDLRRGGIELQKEIATGKALKRSTRAARSDFEGLTTKLKLLEEELAKEVEKTAVLSAELTEMMIQADSQKQQLELALESCEARVRELKARARTQEVEREQVKTLGKKKKLEPLLLTPDVSAYVIDDRVKITGEDIETLRFMIEALEKENAELAEAEQEKMTDIDCLMQENLGLKQLIRSSTEGIRTNE
jgi:hypothetical protein